MYMRYTGTESGHMYMWYSTYNRVLQKWKQLGTLFTVHQFTQPTVGISCEVIFYQIFLSTITSCRCHFVLACL